MPLDNLGKFVVPDNEIPLKLKYRSRKTKGRYKGGEHPAPHRKRHKKGAKTYVYGSWVKVMGPTGKMSMVKVELNGA